MIRKLCGIGSLAVLATAFAADKTPERLDPRAQWGHWRGPLGTGVAPGATPPLTWAEDLHVRWKRELPGKGHSSPVVWGDRIFVTSAVPYGEPLPKQGHESHGTHDNVPATRAHRFVVLALSRSNGAILWERTVHDARPHESTHATGSWASASAATDGEVLVASFGSAGIYGLDLDGNVLWHADLGQMRIKHGHGEGSSPALAGASVLVNWDHEAGSFLVALDKRTGKQRFKVQRDETTSWSSPLVVEHRGVTQVVVAATRRVRAYNLADGKLIWECGGLSDNVVASPVAGEGMVYVSSSYEKRAMLAIRLDAARGDITGTAAVVWMRDRDTPYVPSPLLDAGRLCFLKHYQGLITCVDARSGTTIFGPQRLPGLSNVYASPVAAAGRIYVVGLDGEAVVLRSGDSLEVLARNRLDDSFAASPALVGSEMFLRGERFLYAIAEPANSRLSR
jgi:outer membrane protein assembly factor BamB